MPADAGADDPAKARRSAEMHKDVTRLRSLAKKHGAEAASLTKKALRQEWWASFFTNRAVFHRKKAKKYTEKVEEYVAEIAALKKEMKDADAGKTEKLKAKIKKYERKVAKFRDKTMSRELKAAKHNDRAADRKIRSKELKAKAKSEEEEHDAYMKRADLLEKVTD